MITLSSAMVKASRILAYCALIGLLASSAALAQDQAQPRLQTVTLQIGGKTLTTEIANTEIQRYMGLSFRKKLGENEGMLFVYRQEKTLTFTMRNTLLPLSIAYISKDFVINEIHDMPVGPNQLFPSDKPAQYALEVNQGWFERNNISAGDQIKRQP